MTAYAYLNPFSQFVKNVKDLLGIESGAVINNGDGELSADKNAVVYESIEDLEKAFGLKTLSLNGNNKYTILSIKSYTKNNQNYIEIIYDNDGQSIFETVYPDNAPNDEGCMIKAVTDVLHFNGFDIYMINTDNNVQAVIFDGPVAYCIVGSDRTEIINFITGE